MKLFAFVLLLFCGADAFVAKNERMITADLNDYIDTITPALAEFIINNGMDPMDIPDLKEGFSVKPLWITYHGELELTKGKLTGLRTIRRSGDFMVYYISKILRIRGDFGFNNLGFTYNYLAKIMNIGPTGGVVGTVSKISGVLDMLIDFNNNELHLQDFYLHDVGKITVKLTGNILVDWLSNAIIDVITTLFKRVIVKVVENNLKSAIQEQIDRINESISGVRKLLEDYPMVNIYENYELNEKVLAKIPKITFPINENMNYIQ